MMHYTGQYTGYLLEPHGHRCGCRTEPARFMSMVGDFAEQLARHVDGDWLHIKPFTQRFHWNCAAIEVQQAALAWLAGDRSAIAVASGEEVRIAATESTAPKKLRQHSEHDRLILINGELFTADEQQPWAQALVIEGAHIVYVGDNDKALAMASPASRIIDLDGRLVISGFNDAHMHHTPDPAGIRLPIDPMADPSLSDIMPMIAEAVAASPPGTWLMGTMGEKLMNDSGVHRDALDALAPEHPLMLLGFTNHRNIVNSAALKRLSVDERSGFDSTINPVGGCLRGYADGRLNGVIDEYAMWGPQRLFAAMTTIEEGSASIAALSEDCARFGVTTLQNMSWTPIERYLAMLRGVELSMRMRLIHFPPAGLQGRVVEPPIAVEPGLVTVNGTKWILDGTPVERGAALGRPYADRPGEQGLLNFAPDDVREMLAEQRASGEPLLMHAIGRAAIEQVLEAVAAEPSTDLPSIRIEHGDDASAEQMARIAALNLHVALNPSHLLLPQFFRARYGDSDLVGAIRSFTESGVRISFGSDGPLSPFIGLMGAVINPVNAQQAVSLSDALIAYTHGAAIAEGRGHEKGRLVAGYLADVAVLSMNLFHAAPNTWPGAESELTIVDGAIVRDQIKA